MHMSACSTLWDASGERGITKRDEPIARSMTRRRNLCTSGRQCLSLNFWRYYKVRQIECCWLWQFMKIHLRNVLARRNFVWWWNIQLVTRRVHFICTSCFFFFFWFHSSEFQRWVNQPKRIRKISAQMKNPEEYLFVLGFLAMSCEKRLDVAINARIDTLLQIHRNALFEIHRSGDEFVGKVSLDIRLPRDSWRWRAGAGAVGSKGPLFRDWRLSEGVFAFGDILYLEKMKISPEG